MKHWNEECHLAIQKTLLISFFYFYWCIVDVFILNYTPVRTFGVYYTPIKSFKNTQNFKVIFIGV